MNKVHHIVFADFIGKYLIEEIGVSPLKVHTLPHPIVSSCKFNFKASKRTRKERTFVGLGHANEDSFIKEIIEYEKNNNILKVNNIKLILRSNIKFESIENIELITNFLSREEYDSYYSNSEGLIILYPPHYKYRYSGAILEAFNHQKKVLGTNIPIIRHFESLYPNTCYHFNSVAELFKIIIHSDVITCTRETHSFLLFHSDKNVITELNKILLHEDR
jgi:hypothetical protein